MMAGAVCPCCGGVIARDPLAGLRDELTPMQRRIYDAVHARAKTKAQLIDALWGDDPNGGPDDAGNVLGVHLFKLNQRLSDRGFGLRVGKGRRESFYRLLPLSSEVV